MAKTTTAIATADDAVKPGAPAKKPRIKDIRLNSQNEFAYRNMVAYPPADFPPEYLNDPQCWDGSQVMVHDHVYVIGADQSWSADGVITWTNGKDAVFSLTRRHLFNRQTPLFHDEMYRVVARGGAFDVVNKRSGAEVVRGLMTEAHAIQAIREQYPKKVG